MHLGNVFSCLVAWLSAKSQGGTVVLRIEDLDDRCRQSWSDLLMEDLEWLGLTWDKGPIYQHDRIDCYEHALDTLRGKGLVYPLSDFTNWWQGTLNECTSTEFTIEAEGEYLVFVTTSSLPPLQQSTR